jgi:hypothetical protein
MFNFLAPIVLALAIIGALGTQLATTAYRNNQLPPCAGCEIHAHDLS